MELLKPFCFERKRSKDAMKRAILIRHGSTGPANKGRYLGSTDAPLGGDGEDQARALRSALPTPPFRCIASPMARTMATARIALDVDGRSEGTMIEKDPRLREVDFGEWEGLTFAEISARWPEEVGAWARLDPGFSFPGGESIAEFNERVDSMGRELAALPGDTVLVFTHGGVVRWLLCLWLGLGPEAALAFDIGPAAAAELKLFGERGVLVGLDNSRCRGGD